MYLYLIIFFYLIIFSFLEIVNVTRGYNRYINYVTIVIFVFIAGFRYETGVDWAGYQGYYEEILSLDKAFQRGQLSQIFSTLDVGYALLNSLVKIFDGGIQTIFIVVSLISTTLLYKSLKYFTKYVQTGFLIYYAFYFFVFDMSGLRQGLAVQIVFFAYRFILQRDFKKYLLCILVAGSIHWSALILLLLYFIPVAKKINFTTLILFFCIAVFTLRVKIIGTFIPNLDALLAVNSILANKVDVYTTNESFSESRGWGIVTIYTLIRMAFIFMVCWLLNNKNKIFYMAFNILIVEFICYFGLYELNEVSERLRFYFAISEIILLTYFFVSLKDKLWRSMVFVFICLVSFFNSIQFYLEFPSTVAYHPYQNYIIYKLFDKQSTGPKRLQKHADTH